MAVTTKDNLALTILCSDLGYDQNDEKTIERPFLMAAFNKLSVNESHERLEKSI